MSSAAHDVDFGIITFTLEGADGRSHKYDLTLHPPTEGQRIMWRMIALAAGPAGDLVRGLVSVEDLVEKITSEDGGLTDLLDSPEALTELMGVLGDIDWGSVGDRLGKDLLQAAPDDLTLKLLRYASRDGQALANESHFNDAYRGNYWEMLQALFRIVRENRFFPLPGTS